jgi:hypothetical protein
VTIADDKAVIGHDGTLTVGKLGQAKRADVLNFIREKEPTLLDTEGKVYVGEFNLQEEITGNQEQTKVFISRAIRYALLRDEFRKLRKEGVL